MFFIALIISALNVSSQDETRLMRFPTIYGNKIVFSYAGDLYSVDKAGGIARKLTNHIGYEMFPKFSPDGKYIGFSAQYDGNTEIYTMPSDGGVPKRLTYTATLSRDDIGDRMGPNNITMTWKDNQTIIYRSRKQTFNDFKGQLFAVSTNGGLSEELPLPVGGFCSYSPDKTKLAYNRVCREFRTWKYYKGGMADDVWIFDFTTKKTENITNNVSQDIFPMWSADNIYYLSDRDRIMNMFCYNIKDKTTRKVTTFTEYDIKFPSIGDNAIVFENGGYIYVFDLKTEKYEKVTIKVVDDQNYARNKMVDASKFITSTSVSPDGKRLAIGARGDIFTVPAKSGITKNLTKSPEAHDRNVEWSPDGKYLAFISDKSGEYEVYITEANGSGKTTQITKNGDTYKYFVKWSPDSKKLLWGDKMNRLQYVDIDNKNIVTVDQTKYGEFTSFNWSPDSKWITYDKAEADSKSKIYIYNIDTKKSTAATDGWFEVGSPVFSEDGKYLLFTSDRDFNPIYSATEWNHAYTNMSRIYIITLAKDTKSPFEPINDEVTIKKEEATPAIKDPKTKDKPAVTTDNITKVDIDGLADRLLVLPISAGYYWSIYCNNGMVYYMQSEYGQGSAILKMYDFKERKETDIATIGGYEVSADGKKILVYNAGNYYIADMPKAKADFKDIVSLSNMKMNVDLRAEWKQIYNESWRQMRDFFYDPNMHGVDWNKMKNKYGVLLPYVAHRSDLTYIIGELIGELSVGHAYVNDGDKPHPEKISLGLLGANLEKDPKTGYYKITKILKGQNWVEKVRSPLTEVGVNINEGDYIIAVNGEQTNTMNDIYASLVNTADKQVELTINKTPTQTDAKNIIVIPTDNEADIYYYNWVQANIEKVNKASNGEIGYIHIPNMVSDGLNEFIKYFYPQLTKKALIIDDRGNGGGNVSPMIIERLNRELAILKISRNGASYVSPTQIHVGPKVCLIDNYSASDGDLFPFRFKQHKMGKVIGVRSWCGVVGIRGSLPFVDGGTMQKPEFSHYALDGSKWVIEGYGVDPDIVVDNDPYKEYMGEDQQLNKGIEILKEELKTKTWTIPEPPVYPDKSK